MLTREQFDQIDSALCTALRDGKMNATACSNVQAARFTLQSAFATIQHSDELTLRTPGEKAAYFEGVTEGGRRLGHRIESILAAEIECSIFETHVQPALCVAAKALAEG